MVVYEFQLTLGIGHEHLAWALGIGIDIGKGISTWHVCMRADVIAGCWKSFWRSRAQELRATKLKLLGGQQDAAQACTCHDIGQY